MLHIEKTLSEETTTLYEIRFIYNESNQVFTLVS